MLKKLFGLSRGSHRAVVEAIHESQAIAEFELDGTIIDANENFLAIVGYSLDEIVGKHHSIFVDSAYAGGDEYLAFWTALRRGKFKAAEFRRVAKNGSDVWIQASYNPIINVAGKPEKIVKVATDVTEKNSRTADLQGQVSAIEKSQAVIEFELDGTIITANQKFLDAVGYRLKEIQGKHHRIFVEEDYATSAEYDAFWGTLRRGEYHAAEFRRKSKYGEDVWIQASYNPVLDSAGRTIKVVKIATDITRQKQRSSNYENQIKAIDKSQCIIEFDLDGTIIRANDNYLRLMGYALKEVQGRPHRIFVDAEYAGSEEYAEFWSRLREGEFIAAEFKRIARNGKEVWIQASYNPVLGADGKPTRVVKFATDITEQMVRRVGSEEKRETEKANSADDVDQHVSGPSPSQPLDNPAANPNSPPLFAVDDIAGLAQTVAMVTTQMSQRVESVLAASEQAVGDLGRMKGSVRSLGLSFQVIERALGEIDQDADGTSDSMRAAVATLSDVRATLEAMETLVDSASAGVEARMRPNTVMAAGPKSANLRAASR